MAELGRQRFGLVNAAERPAGDTRPSVEDFRTAHSDHIVITADFPGEDDAYWPGRVLADPADPNAGELECTRQQCEQEFGELPEQVTISELAEARQFSIEDAEQQSLVLEQRYYSERKRDLSALDCSTAADGASCEQGRSEALAELETQRGQRRWLVECCFPSGASYQVRASSQWTLQSSAWGFRHDVIAVPETEAGRSVLECRRDCDPRKRDMRSRIFEIAREQCSPREGLPCQANACVTAPIDGASNAWRAVRQSDAAWACVHQTPTSHFALYQGLVPSRRGMAFSWQVIGGFSPLGVNLGVISSFVSPQAIVPLPDLDRLSVVDASSLGLALISLDGLRPLLPTLN
jgi:hypothetical protein